MEAAQNPSVDSFVVQYAFRGNARKQRKVLLPKSEDKITCSKLKEAILQSNEISPAILPPTKLSVHIALETGGTKELFDNDIIVQDKGFIISLASASDSLNPVLPCIADCKSEDQLQVANDLIDKATKYNAPDGIAIMELLNASLELFKAGQISTLLGMLRAVLLITNSAISLDGIKSAQHCIKALARVFVFLSAIYNRNDYDTDALDAHSVMIELCIDIFMGLMLTKDPYSISSDECIFTQRGQVNERGSSTVIQILTSEGVFDAMVYLFSLTVNRASFMGMASKLIVSIGSFAYKNAKMLDVFTKSGTLIEALCKKLSFDYGNSDFKDELFQLKLFSLNFISHGMKTSHDFEEKVLKTDVGKMFVDVTAWTTINFDASASAEVMFSEAAPTDAGNYIQDYTREKSPQINRLFQFFESEVLDSTSKCKKFIFFALLNGLQEETTQNAAFREALQNYPETLCMVVDVLKAFVGVNPSPKLEMLRTNHEIWNVLFSDVFLLPYCNRRIHFFLRQKITDFVTFSVEDATWEEAREILLTRLYILFSVTVSHESHVIYMEIIASVLSKHVPTTTADVVMPLDILASTTNIDSPALIPRFTLARSSIMHSLLLSFEQKNFLKFLVEKYDAFNKLFPLIKVKGLEAFAANEIAKLIVAAGDNNKDDILSKMVQECLRFVEVFTGKESDDEFSQLMSILHVIAESAQLSARVSKAFVRNGLFPILLTLMTLQITSYPERKVALINGCLLVIYFTDIVDFECMIGYDQFKAVLTPFADVLFQERTEVVDRLFELALRTCSEGSWGAKVFAQNPHFITLIFELLPTMGMTTVIYTLSKLYTIFQSLPNVAACNGVGLTRTLLGIIEKGCVASNSPIFTDTAVLARLVDVVQLLAAYSLSAADLKRIVRLLSRTSPDGAFRLSTFPYLIKCLRKMSIGEIGPNAYYNFDGKTSQFVLPQFEQFPFGQGGTLFMWLRIESLSRKKLVLDNERAWNVGIEAPSPAGTYQPDLSYKPRLLSFVSEDQLNGMEVFIEDGTLYLGVTTDGKMEVFRCAPERYVLPEKRWISLGFVFSPSLIVTASGEFRVYVNGELLHKFPFAYPRNLVHAKYNSVGCVSTPNSDSQSFNGQIGTINFFDSAIDSSQIAIISESGPKFLGSSKIDLENKLYMCYTSKLQKGDIQINNYSVMRQETVELSAKTVNVTPCITVDFKSTVCCIDGSIFSLFPLIQMLEKPLVVSDPNASSDDETLIYILETIHNVILGNGRNGIDEDLCDEMVRRNGYAALSHILRRLPSETLTPKLVDFFGDVYNRMDALPPPRTLQSSLFNEIITDFYVWIRAPYETQEELLSLLYTINYEKKNVINTQKLLDVIRSFYWINIKSKKKSKESKVVKEYDEKDEMSSSDEDDDDDYDDEDDNDIDDSCEEEEDMDYKSVQLCADVSIRTDENSAAEVLELRSILFDIIKVKVEQYAEKEDVEAIVRYVFWIRCVSRGKGCASLENKHGDVLGILDVIDDALEQSNPFFSTKFVEHDGVEALLRLFTLDSEVVRIRTIGSLARLCCAQFSDEEEDRKQVRAISETLLEMLGIVPITFALYNALLKMAIADFANATVEITHMTSLVFPEVLCYCLFPLLYRAPQSIRVRVYDDLEMVLVKRTNAQNFIRRIHNWQYHLCKLLDGERTNFIAWMRSRNENENAMRSEEIARIIELFGKIFNHTAFESIMLCSDWSEISVLLSLLRAYDSVSIVNASSPLPPNNYFHLCRLSFFKAFTARVARIVNGEAQAEYRDVANPTAPQFPLLVSFCVHIFDSLLLVSPSVSRPYIYPEPQPLYEQQQQQQQQPILPPPSQSPRQLSRFSPKRVALRFSAQPQVEKQMQPVPRFDGDNIGDSVDAGSSPSDPDFELYILSNMLAYVDYLKFCTASDWCGAERVKSASPALQAHQGGFISFCAVAAARVLQLYALVGWKDKGRRCKAAIALLQTLSETFAPQGDDGTVGPGFYWIFETTIRSFCVANACRNAYVAEEIFKLIFALVRYIAQFKKLEKFISAEGAAAMSSLAVVTETSPAIYAYKKFNSEEWVPAAKEIHIRAQPWVQGVLADYKRALVQAKKSDDSALEFVCSFSKQSSTIIDSFSVCARVYQNEVSHLNQYAKFAIESNQTKSNEWLRIKKELQRGRGPWCNGENDDANANVKRKMPESGLLGSQRVMVTRVWENGIQKPVDMVECCSVAPDIPEAAVVNRDESNPELFRSEHVDYALVASMVSDEDAGDKVLVKVQCKYIRPGRILDGVCIVSKIGITFKEGSAQDVPGRGSGGCYNDATEVKAKVHTWSRDTICQVYSRRYELNRTALEIFFSDGTDCYLNFETVRVRTYVLSKIVTGLKPPGLTWYTGCTSSPSDALRRSCVTDRWRRHEIGNFEYIMALNTLSGRSFNDVTQYPIFPWVVADFASETLDFNNPSTFRSFSKPIGSQQPGATSLYSSPASVRYFLGRLEPFASCIVPNDRRNDVFMSVQAAWERGLWELTPEFFSLPDFLTGGGGGGGREGNVALPAWAHGSADEFIRVHRAALESDYVTEHLNEWIDLVFGYKQRGKAAVAAGNVFNVCAYEGDVDYTKLRTDTRLRVSAYGQVPDQLFTSAHPVADKPRSQSVEQSVFRSQNVQSWAAKVFAGPVVCVRQGTEPGTVVASSISCEVCTYKVDRRRPSVPPTLRLVSDAQAPTTKAPHLARNTAPSHALFAISDGWLFSCGFWDGSFRMLSVGSATPDVVMPAHRDVVTCVAAVQGVLVAGFRDTTLMLWDIPAHSTGVAAIVGGAINVRKPLGPPRCVLYGHDEQVTAVDVSKELGIVVSGALDGRVAAHALRTGKYLWSGTPLLNRSISCVRIIQRARVVAVYSKEKFSIAFCNFSGKLLAEVKVLDVFNDMVATADGELLILGGRGIISVFSLVSVCRGSVSLMNVYNIGSNVTVCSLAMSSEQDVLFAGLDDGNIIAISK